MNAMLTDLVQVADELGFDVESVQRDEIVLHPRNAINLSVVIAARSDYLMTGHDGRLRPRDLLEVLDRRVRAES